VALPTPASNRALGMNNRLFGDVSTVTTSPFACGGEPINNGWMSGVWRMEGPGGCDSA
jgi:hypothetical protein